MKLGFGKHFTADLYLCQNACWETFDKLKQEIDQLTVQVNNTKINWQFGRFEPDEIRITGEMSDFYLLIQIFPESNFLAVDLFAWQPQIDLQSFSESLINIFAPQVVATETRLRAEHLVNR